MPGCIYAQDEGGIYVNLFIGSRAEVPLPTGKVVLRQTTRYPWQGEVQIAVEPQARAEFDLLVRIPAWCQGAASLDDLYEVVGRPVSGAVRLKVDGQLVEPLEIVRGYARVHRRWEPGDVVELAMDMPVRLVRANPRVAADRGRVALMRGPLVYCLEGLDNGGRVQDLSLHSGHGSRPTFAAICWVGLPSSMVPRLRATAGKTAGTGMRRLNLLPCLMASTPTAVRRKW